MPQGRYDVNDKAGEIKQKHEVLRPQGSEIQKLLIPRLKIPLTQMNSNL